MKKAWTENGQIRDICQGIPSDCYHPTIAAHYITDVPDTSIAGATLIAGTWTNPTITPTVAVIVPPKLSPIEFKMCFTSQERIAITTLKATDAIIADAFLILDDPRLTHVDLSLASNIALIDYLATKIPALTPQRVLDIKAGKMI